MDRREKIFAAVLAAVHPELTGLPDRLSHPENFEFLGEKFHWGTFGEHSLLIGTTGLGKVNAAIITAALLQRFCIGHVWNIGCAGAYREGPLQVGDVLVSERILFGDEGVLQSQEILSTREIGIPVLKKDSFELYDDIPLNHHSLFQWLQRKTPAGRYRLVADAAGGRIEPFSEAASATASSIRSPRFFRLEFGSSLTVGMASGNAATAAQRFSRYGAVAENMEGSAVAQACWRFAVPMVECRGISNTAGDRCKSNWQITRAMGHCHGIVMDWLLGLAASPSPHLR